MKKIILMASAVLIFSQVAFAQQQNTRQAPQSNKDKTEWIENKVDHMDDMLDLSDAQEKKLTKVYKKYFGSNEQMTEERRKAMHAEVRQVLTPAQQQKMDSLRKNRQCPHQGKGTCNHQGNGNCNHQGNGNCNHQHHPQHHQNCH